MARMGRTTRPPERIITVNDDLTGLLHHWAYRPDDFTARLLEGADGRPLLQIRVELGILQLEMNGRPDGLRPDGFETVLKAVRGTTLTVDSARSLRDEIIQFEYRAQSLLFLGEHAKAAHDANHMLQAARLLYEQAPESVDRDSSLAPLLRSIAIRARAAAEAALAGSRTDLAKLALEGGLSELRELLSDGHFEQCNEVHLLTGMKDVLIPRLPASQRVELQDRIRAAIAAENYELAAILRDELRLM
jgi:hypothetical protein